MGKGTNNKNEQIIKTNNQNKNEYIVTYFLINSLPTEIRQQHQYDLIQRYVSALNEKGIAFSIETAKQQYLLHASYVWIASAVTAASDTMQEEKIAASGLIRTSRAMQDLEVEQIL